MEFQGYSEYLKLMYALEEFFECAGVCQQTTLFAMTDVSKGYPQSKCTSDIASFVNKYGPIFGAISIALGLLLFAGVVGAGITCCWIQKDKNRLKLTEIELSQI